MIEESWFEPYELGTSRSWSGTMSERRGTLQFTIFNAFCTYIGVTATRIDQDTFALDSWDENPMDPEIIFRRQR